MKTPTKDHPMININIPFLLAGMPPTPRPADWQIKLRYGEILRNRGKNAVSEANSTSLLCPQNIVGAVASNFVFAGSEVRYVAA